MNAVCVAPVVVGFNCIYQPVELSSSRVARAAELSPHAELDFASCAFSFPQQRIRLVERFVEARKLVKRNPEEMLKLCASLLDTENVDVRDESLALGQFVLRLDSLVLSRMFLVSTCFLVSAICSSAGS